MNPLARGLITGIVALCIFQLSYWLSVAFLPFDAVSPVPTVIALVLAVMAGLLVWRGLASDQAGTVFQTALLWAVIGGGIGFAGGFFGPMIFAPGANQGPLLGIFITGPLGLLFGGLAGLIRGARRDAGA